MNDGPGEVRDESGAVARRSPGWFDRLRRITTSGRFVPEVDGLRFVAVLGVFVFHLLAKLTIDRTAWAGGEGASAAAAFDGGWVAELLAHGHYGVQLFFVISGFVLGLAFVRAADPRFADRFAPGRYYGRRLTRLEPPYLVNLGLLFAALVLMRGYTVGELGPHLLASGLYVHNVVYGAPSVVNPVAWSLEVEVQFYVLAPLLAWPLRIRGPLMRRGVYLGAIGLSLGLRWLTMGIAIPASLPLFLHYFLIGMLLADVWVRDWHGASPNSWWGDVVAALLVPGIVWTWFASPAVAAVLFPPLLAVWFAGVMASRGTRRLLSGRVPVVVGGMCYSFYLWHVAAMWLCGRWLRAEPGASFWFEFAKQGVLLGTAALVVSAVAFVLVERPCMRPDWPRRAWRWLRGGLASRTTELPTVLRVEPRCSSRPARVPVAGGSAFDRSRGNTANANAAAAVGERTE